MKSSHYRASSFKYRGISYDFELNIQYEDYQFRIHSCDARSTSNGTSAVWGLRVLPFHHFKRPAEHTSLTMFDNSLYALTLAFLAGTLVALKALSAKQTSNYHAIQGFILHNKVTHSRLLPKTASHTFSHPTLFFLVSLRALESRTLDLGGGWLFGYGGLYWRLTGLRPSAYLAAEKKKTSIIEKLGQVLRDRMLDADEFEDAWMLTMPSLLGFEGINPLTVYFCYKRGGELCAVVLEVSQVQLFIVRYCLNPAWFRYITHSARGTFICYQ